MIQRPDVSTWDYALSGGGKMGALIRALDWSKTPLGPVQGWPQSLKTSVSICLNSRFPVLIWWGPQLVKIYNDAYVELIGTKHPSALGRPGREVWPEIWDTIGPLLDGVMERGEASWADDLLLMLERNGYGEECYFTFSYSPIRDETGGVGGVFTPVLETTGAVIGERRLRTLRDLATARSDRSRDIGEACTKATQVLASNPYDLPFAGIYLFDEHRTAARLCANTFGEQNEAGLPLTIDFREAGWLPYEQLIADEICLVPVTEAGLVRPPVGPRDGTVDELVTVPIRGVSGGRPTGFLLAGVSPRKRLDAPYRAFFKQVADDLSESARDAHTAQREAELLAEAEAERTKIRDLFMQAPAGILMLQGPDHKVTLVNDQYLQLTRRKSREAFIGRPLVEALPEIAEQGFIKLLDGVLKSGEPIWGKEVKVWLRRGDTLHEPEAYFNFVYQPTRNAAGAVDGILVHAMEVTDQVLARQEVESREEQFRVLANSIPQMAWMANPEGDIFWYNRRWYEYTGKTAEEMAGWGWQSVHDQQVLPEVLEQYKRSLASGEPFDMTFPLRGADGTFRSFLTLALPIRDATGRIVRWFGTNTDMEAQRQTEEALRQAEKLAVVGRLASSIAHEINNPLEAATNLIYLAKAAVENDEAREYLEAAEVELARTAQITTQTLRFHRQLTAPALTDVGEILTSVLPLYRGRMGHLGVELKLDIRECPPLLCYEGEVRQVFANLIGNAIDAMPKGGTLWLRLRAGTCSDNGSTRVRITVADTGHGMTPETMKRLYEPFFTTKEAVGTGLGLWVSAGIIEKHGGTLRVRSSVRQRKSGTVFVVNLPFDKAR